MRTLLVLHTIQSQVLKGLPTQHGGRFQFKEGANAVGLPQSVIGPIEVDLRDVAEFFPTKLTGNGVTLDYVLIPQGQALTESQADKMRRQILLTIEQILLGHIKSLDYSQVQLKHQSSN